MTPFFVLAQIGPEPQLSAWGMILDGTISTKIVLLILAVFSLMSWGLIIWKYFAFRRVWKEAGGFLDHLESSNRLEDASRQ